MPPGKSGGNITLIFVSVTLQKVTTAQKTRCCLLGVPYAWPVRIHGVKEEDDVETERGAGLAMRGNRKLELPDWITPDGMLNLTKFPIEVLLRSPASDRPTTCIKASSVRARLLLTASATL